MSGTRSLAGQALRSLSLVGCVELTLTLILHQTLSMEPSLYRNQEMSSDLRNESRKRRPTRLAWYKMIANTVRSLFAPPIVFCPNPSIMPCNPTSKGIKK